MKKQFCSGLCGIPIKRQELENSREGLIKFLSIVCAIQFSLVLVWMLWLKFGEPYYILRNYNAISSMTLKERFLFDIVPFIHTFESDVFKRVLVVILNCFIFAPFGILFNLVFEKKSVLRDMLICFAFSLAIELIQLFSIIGSFATDDLITNTIGYLLGYAVYKFFFERLSPKWQTRLLGACNLCLFALVIVATVRTIDCFDVIKNILTRAI